MSLIQFNIGGAQNTKVIALPSNNFLTSQIDGLTYSGLKIGSDGLLYERQPGGGWSSFDTWLVTGTNTDFWVTRSVTSGSLTTDAGGTHPTALQLNSDRIWDVQTETSKVCSVLFKIWDVSDGTVLMASATYTFDASTDLG